MSMDADFYLSCSWKAETEALMGNWNVTSDKSGAVSACNFKKIKNKKEKDHEGKWNNMEKW